MKYAGSQKSKLIGLLVLIGLIFLVRALVFPGTTMLWWILGAAVLVLGWGIWIFISAKQEKEKNEAIAGSLLDGAKGDEASARPDRREMYRRTRENLEHAINLLEKSRPKGFKGAALYRLPWFMVVGPPSDGKTTAIKNAGIRWPQEARMEEASDAGPDSSQVGGAGGTRSCNWFFSSDAIILDTAGRWQAREQGKLDEQEWLEFLDMLQKHRPQRPINGIIALCSIERVLGGREESRKWSHKIRQQINEVMQRLGAHVPVYLIFNKCDLIHGFIEFFQDLNRESRKQIWGFTREYNPQVLKTGDGLASDREAIMADVDRELERLVQVLDSRRMHRLADPQLFPSEKAALCIFPSEFNEVKGPLRDFVADVFDDNPFGHNPILRGVYFTSATQFEGSPIAALMKQVAGEYDIPLDALPASNKQAVDSYFLQELMTEVIFKDAALGGRFKRSLFDRTRRMIGLAVVGATFIVTAWMLAAYLVNRSQNNNLLGLAERVANISLEEEGSAIPVLETLDSLRTGLEDYANTGSWYGMFNSFLGVSEYGQLANEGRKLLAWRTDETFINDVWKASSSVLGRARIADLSAYVDNYRSYLYLSDDSMGRFVEPGVVSREILRRRFSQVRKSEEYLGYSIKLNELLRYYTRYAVQKKLPANQKLLGSARQKINRNWSWARLSKEIVKRDARFIDGFTTAPYDYIENDIEVPYGYTHPGWTEYAQELLDSANLAIRSDTVLISILAKNAASKRENPLKDAYVKECKEVWSKFISGLKLRAPSGFSTDQLYELSGESSPVAAFMRDMAENTQFRHPLLNANFSAIHAFTGIVPSRGLVDDVVQADDNPGGPAPLNQYLSDLDDAILALEEAQSSYGSSDCVKGFSSAKKAIDRKRSKAGLKVFSRSSFSKKVLNFLRLPFEKAVLAAGGVARSCLNEAWRSGPYATFQDEFADAYPFSRSGANEVAQSDILEFVDRDGYLQSFEKDEFQPAKNAGYKPTPGYKKVLSVAKQIEKLLNGGSSLKLEFSSMLSSKNFDQLIVSDSRGVLFRYRNGPNEVMELDLPWDGVLSLELELNTDDYIDAKSFEGAWAPLRLLDFAKLDRNKGKLIFVSPEGTRYWVGFTIVSPAGKAPTELFQSFVLPERACR